MIQDPNVIRVIQNELKPLLKEIELLKKEVKELKEQLSKKVHQKAFHEREIIPKRKSSSEHTPDDIIQDSKNNLWDSPPMGGFKDW